VSALEISVVVITRDAEALLPGLLASLRAQTLDPGRFEVLVVDNGSHDDGARIARDGGARVVEHPDPHRGVARNLGAQHARSDLFAFVDADCLPGRGWLEALLDCATQRDMLAGPVLVTTGEPPNAIERFERIWRFDQEAWVRQGWAATANLCVRRAVMDAIGGFDPAMANYGEDADFCTRAARAGFGIAFCPDAVVTHPADDHLWPLLRRSFRHGHGGQQAYRRLGPPGYSAWRRPGPLRGDRALRMIGVAPESFEAHEWHSLARLARVAYAARMAGSLWGELTRVG
jgi:GT2 family glycosyltransferase